MSIFAGAQERLNFVINLDPNGAIRAFGQVRVSAERDLGAVDNRLDRIGGQMQAVGAGAVAFSVVAGRALFGFAKASEDAEAESRKLDLAIRNNADAVGESRKPYEDLAESLQDLTGADGDAVIGLEGLLGTLGRNKAEILELTPLVVDFATRYGMDLEAAGRMVNTAYEGNTTRLERLIGRMHEGESVTEALRRSVGGFAEQEAQSLTGQLHILQENLGDITEGIGSGVVGAVNTAVGPVGNLVDRIAESDPALLQMTGRVATIGTAAVGAVGGVSLMAGTVIRMRDNLTTATGSATAFATAMKFAGVAAAVAIVASEIKAINDEAKQMAHTLEDEVRGAVEGSSSFDQFRANLGEINNEIERQSDILAGSQAPWDADKRVQLHEMIDSLEALQSEYGNLETQILQLAESEGISRDEATQRILATQRETTAHNDLVAAVGEEAAADQEASEIDAQRRADAEANIAAVDREREAIDRRRQAKNDELEATLAQFDKEIANRRAERETAQAYSELNAVIAEHGRNSEEAAVATDQAADAALRQAQAAGDLAIQTLGLDGATNEANVRQDIMRQTLQNIADSLAPNSPLRAQLQGYIDSLNELDGRQVEVDILASYGLTGSGVPLTITRGARARGGPVKRGGAYDVAEDGSEVYVDAAGNAMLIPGSDGKVIPNDRIGVGAGAPSIVQHFNVGGEFDEFTMRRLARTSRQAAADAWREYSLGVIP